MNEFTDPAREFTDLCSRLAKPTHRLGSDWLAENFDVQSWSAEFYQIVFYITSRANDLTALIESLEIDDDIKSAAISNMHYLKQAFGPHGLQNQWNNACTSMLTPANIDPIRMLSGMIRKIQSYPKLNNEELSELIGLIDQLNDWLVDHQLVEHDFIRYALIEGLSQLKFRIERVGWIGWGYTIQSLRDVINAYFALQRCTPTNGANPPAEAMLKLVGDFVKKFYEKAKFTKDVVETGDWMLRAYGAVSLIAHENAAISGLLK